MKYLVLFMVIGHYSIVFAGNLYEIEGNVGMISVNYSEIASTLTGPNVSPPESGSFSVIASSLAAHFYKHKKYSFYLGGTVPMLATQGVGYLSGFLGGEYFFNDVAHMVHDSSPRLDVYIQPKFRYHVNVEGSINFLTYATSEAKKSDVSFGLGVGGGGSYIISDDWAVKLKVIASKDFGLITDGIALKFFLGGIYFLDL